MAEIPAAADELVRAFTAAVNAGNYDALREFFVDDYHDRFDNAVEPIDEIIEKERERAAAFSNKHEALDVILTDPGFDEGTHLEVWYEVTGTHDGDILSLPPSGNDVTFPYLRFITLQDGEIVRYREGYTLGFLLDLGLDWDALTDEVDLAPYMTTPEAAGSARAD